MSLSAKSNGINGERIGITANFRQVYNFQRDTGMLALTPPFTQKTIELTTLKSEHVDNKGTIGKHLDQRQPVGPVQSGGDSFKLEWWLWDKIKGIMAWLCGCTR